MQTKCRAKIQRKARVIAILKPEKDPSLAKSFRPISVSLLCHPFKLFESLVLQRLKPLIKPNIILQQAGFRKENL